MLSIAAPTLRRVNGKTRYIASFVSSKTQKRDISVSVTSASDQASAIKSVNSINRSCKKVHINITDFGLKLDVLDQVKLLKNYVDFKESTVIISAANSIDDPLGRFQRIIEAMGSSRPASIMIVKGSSGLALDQSDGAKAKIKSAYDTLCSQTHNANIPLTLTSDITLDPQFVMSDILYKMDGLGASIISTQPLIDPTAVSAKTREFLRRILKDGSRRMIIGQLRHTARLYNDYTRPDLTCPSVGRDGKDKYLLSDVLRNFGEAGGWDEVTRVAVMGSKILSKQIQPGLDFSSSTQTRIGLKVTESDLAFLADIIESDEMDVTDAVVSMLQKSGGIFTESEARALTKKIMYGQGH